MLKKAILPIFLSLAFLINCNDDGAAPGEFEVRQVFIGQTEISLDGAVLTGVPLDTKITIVLSSDVLDESLNGAVSLVVKGSEANANLSLSGTNTIVISPVGILQSKSVYTVAISDQLRSTQGANLSPISFSFETKLDDLEITSITTGDQDITNLALPLNLNPILSIFFQFSSPVDITSFTEALDFSGSQQLSATSSDDGMTVHLQSTTPLDFLKRYELELADSFVGAQGESFSGYEVTFYTQLDSTYKFPEISDDELLTKVQEQTFKYFWDFAHPTSGLIRERNTSGNTVTIGGSGFGVMAILVGIERGFITREDGVDRLEKIVSFLQDDADRFHGVWSHWLNGSTGTVVPFSTNDNGGDLVETAFMIQGLITVRQYLDNSDSQEAAIISRINTLCDEVEWDWYQQDNQDVLYWHWSPNFEWAMNLPVRGWNESLIVYVLAASSTTHGIDKGVYTNGWARNGDIRNSNNNTYFGHTLEMRTDRGGPLFFSHYSFLGLDPRNLSDEYANYWTQNVNHSLINQAYCEANPLNFVGYSSDSWGLTASDNHQGYSAHHPDNDLGVITPTAAISSIPYTPEESMAAIRHFYYLMGDRLWGEYGFYDAFNVTEEWYASSYLAIDQGPIICMIENHRSGLLWDLFMSAPEIQQGLNKLDFSYE